jgi:hypothetical protein
MRFLVRVIFDIEAGNRTASDPDFIKNTQAFMEKNKAEAAYFTVVNGERNAIFVIDMPSADMMPVIALPFFQMGARVEFFPTMNLEDLSKGLSAAIK